MMRYCFRVITCAVLLSQTAGAQATITSPLRAFGHNIGDDYKLINYQQLMRYWQTLDRESDRMKVERIGTSAEGRPMLMAIITSPENHRQLARYQDIARRLALAEGLTDAQARSLAADGKAVVWIDGGLHATEVLGAQQLVQFVYEMVSRNDPETRRFLRDVILLAVLANPDGMDLVSDWYMRETDSTKRSLRGVPRLYQKYVGHDNNRDSYLASQPETQAMDSILFRAWYPQIMYNHHQTAPEGTIMFAPPFRDPFNYNFDPLIPVQLDLVGGAMHTRFVSEGKPGVVTRKAAGYSTWWNGGLRTTVYFHNMIGLLTETFGDPAPREIELDPDVLLPSSNVPFPILPRKWRFAQSLAYELTANRAVLDIASRYRETFLYNIYRMGRNSIERGSRDSWTLVPNRVERLRRALAADTARRSPSRTETYLRVLQDPATRDPRGYIIPSDQADFATATKFVNALIKTGVTVHRAARPFTVAGRSYPAGSYVVKAAQAFRPHILDMFEPQNHPNDIPYPGGPPTPPYDNAGWTLAFQMGVKFDRILDAFDGPFEKLRGFAPVPAANVASRADAPAYVFSRQSNDAFAVANQMMARGFQVHSLTRAVTEADRTYSTGSFVVTATPGAFTALRRIATERGVSFNALSAPLPAGSAQLLRVPRVALWDVYGGSMSSGWMRFVLEQFEFPYQVVFAPDIDRGNLNSRFDVLILPHGATLDTSASVDPRFAPPDNIPAEWRPRVGRITLARTLPQLRSFVENGGTLLALGSAATIASHLQLPLSPAAVDSAGRPLPRSRYYVPGSVLNVAVDTTSSIALGMPSRVDVFFDNSPAFRVQRDAAKHSLARVAWFDSPAPLRSGWAWGQEVLDGATAIAAVPVGRGTVVLYGPEVHFRSQSHGAFRFLFNGIHLGAGSSR